MLDISFGLLIFVIILFLLLVYLLNDMLYKPLLAFMDKRDRSIRDDLASAKKSSDEIDDALSEAEKKISIAKSEAAKIKEDALAKAKELAALKLEESKKALDIEYTAFIEQLSKDRDLLKREVSANLSSYRDGVVAKIKNI